MGLSRWTWQVPSHRLLNRVLLWCVLVALVGHTPLFGGGVHGVQGYDPCRKTCTCLANRTKVSCRGAGLTAIPPKLPHNIRELDLEGNRIGSLKDGVLSTASTLRKLNLRHNNISYIHANAFSNLTHLKSLDLAGNWIENLSANVFAPCPQLKELNLAHNFLGLRVLNISMTSLPKLHSLDISKNTLGPQLPLSFASLTHLKELNIKRVHLGNMSADFFLPLEDVHLRHLDLSQSYIEYVPKETFTMLPKLNDLDLSYASRSITILKNIFWGLQNSSIDTLFLQDTLINSGNDSLVPADLFADLANTKLRKLHFEGNYLAFRSALPPDLFRPLHSLRELYLERCDLHSLFDGSFQGLRHLQSLSLRFNLFTCTRSSYCGGFMTGAKFPDLERITVSNNAISNAQGQVIFDGENFPSLLYLSLKNNSLEFIKMSMFIGLEHLQYLDLSNNPIQSIEPASFQSLLELQRLEIAHCHSLTSLQNDTLRGLRNLISLQMHDNALLSMEKGALLGAKKLVNINLRKNYLGGGTPSFSQVLLESPRLQKLDLGENRLEAVPAGILVNRANLTYIYLDFNRISECSALDNIPHLKVLNLSFNSLAAPSISCFKQYASRPLGLSLAGNPFYCACDTLAFASWLNQSDIIIESGAEHICTAGPSEAVGKQLFEYKLSEWNCHRKFIVVPILTALISGLAVFVILSLVYAFRFGHCMLDTKLENESNSDSSCSCNDCVLGLNELHSRHDRVKKGRSNNKSHRPTSSTISEVSLIRNEEEEEDMDDVIVHVREDDLCSGDDDIGQGPKEVDNILTEVIESNIDGYNVTDTRGQHGLSTNGRGPLPI